MARKFVADEVVKMMRRYKFGIRMNCEIKSRVRIYCTSQNGEKDNDQTTGTSDTGLHQYTNSQLRPSMLDLEFSPSEISKILDIFNTASEEELLNMKYFTGPKVEALVQHRDGVGMFQNLSNILTVTGFGILGLKKMCHSIVRNELKSSVKTNKRKAIDASVLSLCYPRISQEKCQKMTSLVALDVQFDRISWAHMDRDLFLLDWHQTIIFDRPMNKFDHVLFQDKINEALCYIPVVDTYVIENKVYKYQSLRTVPSVVCMRMMEAMLIAMLNAPSNTGNENRLGVVDHKVYALKPYTISKHFNLLVGGERVSGQHVIRNIINRCEPIANDVYIPDPQADYFYGQEHQQQESLARTLLQAVSFYQLIVDKYTDITNLTKSENGDYTVLEDH